MSEFKKYPDILRLGDDDVRDILAFQEDLVYIEEKVDGGNGSFWVDAEWFCGAGIARFLLTTSTDNNVV